MQVARPEDTESEDIEFVTNSVHADERNACDYFQR